MRYLFAVIMWALLLLSSVVALSNDGESCINLDFTPLTDGLNDTDMNQIIADHRNYIYASSSSSLYASYDWGRRWKSVFSLGVSGKTINTVKISSSGSGTIYLGTDVGLYVSRDAGHKWERLFSGIGPGENSVLSVIDIYDRDELIFVGTADGLFQSDDGGLNWQKTSGLPASIKVLDLQYHDGIIYALTERGLYKGNSEGAVWINVYSSKTYNEGGIHNNDENTNIDNETVEEPELTSLVIDRFDPEKLYLGTQNGILVSGDAGRTWRKDYFQGSSGISVRKLSIAVADETTENIYAATSHGLYCFDAQTGGSQVLYKGVLSGDIRYVSIGEHLGAAPVVLIASSKGLFSSSMDGNELLNTDMNPEHILRMFSHEPTIGEIRDAAIRYAEVEPEKIRRWREAAKKRAWLPELRFSYDKNKDWQSSTYFYSTTTQKYTDDDITQGKDDGWTISLTWELGDLIWNDDQTSIDSRSRLMVQLRDDIVNEVTRLYYERRRLQVKMVMQPGSDARGLIEDELRLQELTAGIDALTGGYLSNRIGER